MAKPLARSTSVAMAVALRLPISRSPLPMPGHPALVSFGRALSDVDHVGDAVLALPRLAAGLAQ
jgi:hypothetical protein